MTSPILEVANLTKHFPIRRGLLARTVGAVRAVDGVSFALAEGETFGLVGESGCGKSTLVKTLLYLEPPTAGEVLFRGEPVTAAQAQRLRRHVQIVFQDPYTSLPPRMTVGDIVADPLRIHGIGDRPSQQARVRQLFQEVGLDPRRVGQYPFQFSGGQQQRIGIARALAIEPSLVLLDEAVSALDVSVQAQVLNLLKDLQERYRLTYVFISHDLGVVRAMSDRIAVMYLGKVVELGTGEDIYRRAAHPYTDALIKTIPLPDPAAERAKTEIGIRGELPSPIDPPSGCRFRTRCPRAQDLCAREEPLLRRFSPTQQAACHFPLQEPEASERGGAASAAPAS